MRTMANRVADAIITLVQKKGPLVVIFLCLLSLMATIAVASNGNFQPLFSSIFVAGIAAFSFFVKKEDSEEEDPKWRPIWLINLRKWINPEGPVWLGQLVGAVFLILISAVFVALVHEKTGAALLQIIAVTAVITIFAWREEIIFLLLLINRKSKSKKGRIMNKVWKHLAIAVISLLMMAGCSATEEVVVGPEASSAQTTQEEVETATQYTGNRLLECPEQEGCFNRNFAVWVRVPKGTQEVTVQLQNVNQVSIWQTIASGELQLQMDWAVFNPETQTITVHLFEGQAEFVIWVSTENRADPYGILAAGQ